MGNLYKDLAPVYEAMYHTFIDYQAEYECYGSLLKKYAKKQVLEIGCGTGNLADYFQKNGFDYRGMDLNQEMIDLATIKAPTAEFIKGDMRTFQLHQPIESIIITARTSCYLSTNQAVQAAFGAIHKNLKIGGILSFDFIDANQFIPSIVHGKEITHTANYQGLHYSRKSFWQAHLVNGMDFKWESVYYQKVGTELKEIGRDDSIIRTFTKDEIILFLSINGFKVLELIERASYAFPTYVVVAEKIGAMTNPLE
ncbi:MAG: class I SAM-dependent methyltransferase [Saprospiraceae bacterium]